MSKASGHIDGDTAPKGLKLSGLIKMPDFSGNEFIVAFSAMMGHVANRPG
ncbi:MAG: hypothetical protein IIA06_08805 [Proteobacteria bacterium]|nr:hypothetical protein [Pseudomonadota bacterium]